MSRLYQDAARVLGLFQQKRGGIKTLAFHHSVSNKRAVYAVVCQTIKYESILEQLLKRSGLKQKASNWPLVLVLCYELLFGSGKIRGGGKVKRLVTAYSTKMKQQLARLKIERGVASDVDLLPPELRLDSSDVPRYARVNTIKVLSAEVLRPQCVRVDEFSEQQDGDDEVYEYKVDEHVSDLLLFPPGTELHASDLVARGKLILQDKASCFPAAILAPRPGGHYVDACAAPGNKTSHLAALMNRRGRLDACELSPERCELLTRMLDRAGALPFVKVRQGSFLDVDWSSREMSDVEGILLDPTCSGSGMVHRLDHWVRQSEETPEEERERVAGLADFQVRMLSHALSCGSAKRVVYSTCSVHDEENELVVARVLEQFGDRFQVVPALPSWPRRGRTVESRPETAKWAHHCVRALAQEDKMNGFFVALFERKDADKTEERAAKRKREGEGEGEADTTTSAEERRRQRRRAKKKRRRQRQKEERQSAAAAAAAAAAGADSSNKQSETS